MNELIMPNEFVELSDVNVEILILTDSVKRLDIRYAPNLKKIINFSESLIIGPEKAKGDIPALNRCPKLNEIITLGYIKFNTKIETNGKSITCAWTGVNDEVVPTLTSVGSEYFGDFPCYYYDTKSSIEEVDTALIYAYPTIRECKTEEFKLFIDKTLQNIDEISSKRFSKEREIYDGLNNAPVKVLTRFSK